MEVTQIIHKLPAGMLPGSEEIEIFGDRNTRKVYFLQGGRALSFDEMPEALKKKLLDMLLKDDLAMNDLQGFGYKKALEEFAFCVYGTADSNPDFDLNGEPQESDNFRCNKEGGCHCMKWQSKCIDYNGKKITGRQLTIIDLLKVGLPGKAIAARLGITESTLNTHKKNLFTLFECFSNVELVAKAIGAKIIQ
jgi:DNA-binding CsgD family transcriptional regulator